MSIGDYGSIFQNQHVVHVIKLAKYLQIKNFITLETHVLV